MINKINLKSTWLLPIFILSISIILGIILIKNLPPIPIISDFLDYDTIGQSLAFNNTYITISDDNLIYPPLYPIFLSIIYKIFGYSHSAVYIIQFLLVGIIASLFYKISNKYFVNKKIFSILISLTIIFWPYMMLYSLVISNEVLFILFLTLFTYFFLKFINNPSKNLSVIMGIFIGLAVLTRPVALLLPLWLIMGISIFSNLSKWKLTLSHLKLGLLSFLFFIITLLPWITFVYIKFDRIIPVASNLSAVTDKANNSLEYLKGTWAESLIIKDGSLRELIKTKMINMLLFWNPGAGGYNVASIIEKHPKISGMVMLYKIGFVIIVLLGLGSVYYLRSKKEVAILLAVILYFWTLHTVLFPFPRYTLPVIPIMIILAFYMLNTIMEFYKTCLKKS